MRSPKLSILSFIILHSKTRRKVCDALSDLDGRNVGRSFLATWLLDCKVSTDGFRVALLSNNVNALVPISRTQQPHQMCSSAPCSRKSLDGYVKAFSKLGIGIGRVHVLGLERCKIVRDNLEYPSTYTTELQQIKAQTIAQLHRFITLFFFSIMKNEHKTFHVFLLSRSRK
jgi:hypothetical protein